MVHNDKIQYIVYVYDSISYNLLYTSNKYINNAAKANVWGKAISVPLLCQKPNWIGAMLGKKQE